MKPTDFLSHYAINGELNTRNGPRLYIDKVPGRVQTRNSPNTSQRAYIDLSTYTAHVVTQSSVLSTRECQLSSREVQAKLAPVARLARIRRVSTNGRPVPYTQARHIFSELHAAGITCAANSRTIILDIRRLVRMADVPWLPTAEKYEVRLDPMTQGIWGRNFNGPVELLAACAGNPLQALRVNVASFGAPEQDVVDKLTTAAKKMLHDVFNTQTT